MQACTDGGQVEKTMPPAAHRMGSGGRITTMGNDDCNSNSADRSFSLIRCIVV